MGIRKNFRNALFFDCFLLFFYLTSKAAQYICVVLNR